MTPQFIHLRDKTSSRGGITVAYHFDSNDSSLNMAIARCSDADNFCKQTGRIKAAGRLRSPAYTLRDYTHDFLDLETAKDRKIAQDRIRTIFGNG